ACDRGGAQDEASSDDPMLEALADTLLPRLERLSRLRALRPVELERRTTEQVREYVDSQLEEELPASELEGIRNTYAFLGLVPDSLDLRALLLDLYAEQIVGYYDPTEKKLFVVEGVGAAAVMPVLAHELVHALQDQHINLDSLIARERGNDRQSAAQAAIEGHATLVMFSLLAEDVAQNPVDPATLPNPADQLRPGLEAQTSDFPVFRTAPRILRETLLFPYVAGSRFVQDLWRSQPEAERSAPIGAFLPQSTEQVLNPIGRFVEVRDDPTDLLLEDAPATDGAGNTSASDRWTAEYENGLGRLEVGLFLEEHLGIGADSAAEGWDGDRFRLLRSPGGERALVWYSIWDDDASADRFARAVREILASKLDRAGSVTRIPIDGRAGVRVTLARPALTEDVAVPGVRIAH
ncbi:MAG: hypothetical protein ACREMQ_02385, partial [Longimicrobiales bacterium]